MPPFQPGKSGNPAGRSKIAVEFRSQARKYADQHVIDAWIDEIEERDREVPTLAGPIMVKKRGKEWVRCSELLAAYAYGKPTQPMEHSGSDGAPLDITVKFVKAGEK